LDETSLSLLTRLRRSPESESWNRLVELYAPLALDRVTKAVAPTTSHVDKYPLVRRFWLTVKFPPGGKLNPRVAEFVRLIYSRQGQAIVIKDGYAAGSPDVIDAIDPYASFEGRLHGELVMVSTQDGKELDRMRLPSPPRFDGIIAADRRLFMSLEDGSVVCLGSKQPKDWE
jgi:hypothetical protein